MEKMFLSTMRKDEMKNVKKFKVGKNIKRHFIALEAKFEELEIPVAERHQYLLDSLDDDVKDELFTQLEYSTNKKSYTWIKD